jgi:SulP family sulfate permease
VANNPALKRWQTHSDLTCCNSDESLYFVNARYLEDLIYQQVASNHELKHFILMCPTVNLIKASALESLEAINQRLKASGVNFYLSEVKGPVMDQSKRSQFLTELTGGVCLSQFDAWQALCEKERILEENQ